MQRAFRHANHARGPRIGGHLRHGVEIILLFQIGNLLLATDKINFAVTPVAAVLCGENIGVDRLMRAVECAKTKMHNARNQGAAIVLR